MTDVRKHPWLEVAFVLALTALAFLVRSYHLHAIPPGLYGDEAVNGLDILDILDGRYSLFFERNSGREPLFIYLQAISVALLGATPFALRVTSAVIGALTVPAVYWMSREAFASRPDRIWIAAWTSLFVTFSYWHIIFSRIGLRAIMLPLMAALTFGWFWRAWNQLEKGRRFPWASLCLCGLFCGAALYTYLSARFVPVVLVVVVGLGVWLNRRIPGFGRKALAGLVLIGAIAALVFVPLGVYFAEHPGSFAAHSASVALTNAPSSQRLNPPVDLLRNAVKTLGMFGVKGDEGVRHNPGQRPALDPLLALWLVAGIIVAIRRWRTLPYAFVLIWFGIMLLPGILSQGAPHFLRTLGAVPPVFLLAVLAMMEVARRLALHSGRVALLLPLPFLVLSTANGMWAYYVVPDRNALLQEELRYDNATWLVEDAIPVMASRNQAESVWVVPYVPVVGKPIAPESIVQFLTNRQVDIRPVNATEPTVSVDLSMATRDHQPADLLRLKHATANPSGIYVITDYKNLTAFLLSKYGELLSENDQARSYDATYRVPTSASYRITTSEQPANISFADKMRLQRYAYGGTAAGPNEPEERLDRNQTPSGDQAWAVLRWEALQPLDNTATGELNRYPSGDDVSALAAPKASLYLTDPQGHLAGQVDDFVVGDKYLLQDVWPAGDPASSYHILPTLPAIPPGSYKLWLAVYDAKSGRRYPLVDAQGQITAQAAYLGPLEITRALTPATVSPQNPLPSDALRAAGVTLLGYDLGTPSLRPGDTLPLTLYWRTDAPPPAAYRVILTLKDAQGAVVARRDSAPANGTYPTSLWSPGEVIRDWHDLPIPRDAPGGSYRLTAALSADGRTIAEADLGAIEIGGRPREFTPPTVQQPLACTLGDTLALVGYDLEAAALHPAAPLALTLYWQSRQPVDTSYTVFAHLLGPDGQVWGQSDQPPMAGAAPTTSWVAGEFIRDPITLALRAGAPAGPYQIEIGMYDPATGVRLPVRCDGRPAADHVVLAEIPCADCSP